MFGLSGSRVSPIVDAARRDSARPDWLRREEVVMGTAVSVELWSADVAAGHSAIDAVMSEMHRIDRAMSPHKPGSELSRINRDAAQRAVPVSAEMWSLLQRALLFSRLTGGAFDITYAAVGQLYDYRRGVQPTEAALTMARAAVGYRHLQLDAADRSVRFGQLGMRIDLGGFAKGHAVDCAAAILRCHGIRHAYISAGGDSRVIGDRRGRPWTIGIRHPRQADAVAAVLPLVDVSVSTSGDYERYFDVGGERVHHLIDPATGRSPKTVHSVTVLADDGLTTEALSKAVFVLGRERGLALIDAQPGVDAVVIDAAGALHYSAGLRTAAPAPAAHQRQLA